MVETKDESVETKSCGCRIREMRREDVMQVSQIDREAFPTMWPPVNFHHELENKLAHYLVAYQEEETIVEPVKSLSDKGFSGFMKRLFGAGNQPEPNRTLTQTQSVLGFIGIWLMADEAHVINIAVREKYRHQGVGELLLIAGLDLAIKLTASLMTLEVRLSNTVAQNLYTKYTFVEVGIRRGYYTDNKEDAVLMTTDNLSSESFREKFRQLKETHLKKLGISDYEACVSLPLWS